MREPRRPARSGRPWTLGLLGPLLSASCFYTFANPVEKEPPGSVAGTIALQGAVGGQTPAGGHVTVQWTNGLELTLNSSSTFLFQDLPDGTYVLEINIPALAANDFPLELLRPNVSLPSIGNTADSLDLGTLQVPASGAVGGTVSPPAAGIVVAAFVPIPIPNESNAVGLGNYEGFSTKTDSSGHYLLTVPAGNHALAASDASASAAAPATVPTGASVSVDLTMQPVSQLGQVTGTLVGTGFGASAATTVFPLTDVEYAASASGAKIGDGGLIVANVSQGAGSAFKINVAGGNAITLTLTPPPQASTNPCDEFGPLTLPAVPIIAGYPTSLGQVTWLNNAALAANGVGPCSDAGSSSFGDGGTTDAGPALSGWVDAGLIPWDGGDIQQTVILPVTSDGGGSLVAWIAGQPGQYDLYSEDESAGAGTQVQLTNQGQVSPGSLSGAPVASGVLLTFSTTTGTACEYVSPGVMPQGVTPALPSDPSLGTEQTTTFAAELNGFPGVFVFQPLFGDAGVVGIFTADGRSFGSAFALVPGASSNPVTVSTLIGTSCDVADLKGMPGFCLAGSGLATVKGQPTLVGFVSSFAANSPTPVLSNTAITQPLGLVAPTYEGFTDLPGLVAFALGSYGSNVYFWLLSDLSVAAGPGIIISPQTDLLLDDNGQVLGLSLAQAGGTAGEFLPAGDQIEGLAGLVNGQSSVVPTAYIDPENDDLVTAGVPNGGPSSYNGMISILRLPPDGG